MHSSNTTLRYDAAAMAFCLGLLVLSLIIGLFHEVGTWGMETDFYGTYAVQAQRILLGQPYTYRHNTPGYMLILAAASLLTGDFFVAGKMMSAFAAALLCWVTYLLFKALFEPRIAFATTVLLSFAVIPFSFIASTDLLGAAAVMLCVWIVLRRPEPAFSACLLGGIFAGAAYLLRSPTIFVVLGIGLSLLLITFHNEPPRNRLARVGVYFCGFIAITSPWFLYNWEKNGSPFASTAYLQIAAHFYDPLGDSLGYSVFRQASRFHSLSDIFLSDPQRVLTIYIKDVLYGNVDRLIREGLGFPAFLFAGTGLLLLLRDLSGRTTTILVVCLLGYLLSALVGFTLRYYFFLFPVLFLSVAYSLFHERGLTQLGQIRLPKILTQRGQIELPKITISWLMFMMFAAFGMKDAYKAIRQTLASEPRHLIDVSRFLRERSTPNEIMIVRKPHLAHLTGLQRRFFLVESSSDWLAKAREVGARYIVYSDYEAREWPGLSSLRDPDNLPKGFSLIYRHEPTHTLIYEIG